MLLLAGLAFGAADGDADPSIPRDGVDLAGRLLAGQMVVVADVVDVALRCDLRVIETLRGPTQPDRMKIVFRGINMERSPKNAAFDPDPGERAVFVLGPALDSRGEPIRDGPLAPRGGFRARIPIPAEGSEALLAAVRAIIKLQDESSQAVADRLLSDWLRGPNPWLVDVALDQTARFGIDDPQAIPSLLNHTRDAAPLHRRRALEALARWLERGGLVDTQGAQLAEDLQSALEVIVRAARTDEAPEVRQAAVKQIVSLRPEGVLDLLAVIAKDDPAQEVRYEAAAGALTLRRAGLGTGAGGSR